MAQKRRIVSIDTPMHVYQKSNDGCIIFYDDVDFLVFLTVLSVVARKHGVKILGLAMMVDHVHILVLVDSKETLSSFVRDYSSIFAAEYNADSLREGRLFKSPFGSAPKYGDKKVRTATAYVFNNPVEKGICRRAIEYRWNLMAYFDNANPFSKRKYLKDERLACRKALKAVTFFFNEGKCLPYHILRALFAPLDDSERRRITDKIVSLYNPVDYDLLIRYYGSFEKMVTAFDSNTGSEYDIKEDFNRESDDAYGQMCDKVRSLYPGKLVKRVITLSPDEKKDLSCTLYHTTDASTYQINKFLRTGGPIRRPDDRDRVDGSDVVGNWRGPRDAGRGGGGFSGGKQLPDN